MDETFKSKYNSENLHIEMLGFKFWLSQNEKFVTFLETSINHRQWSTFLLELSTKP